MLNRNQEVPIEVVVQPESGGRSVFDPNTFPTQDTLAAFRPPKAKSVEAARKLQHHGFKVYRVGDYSISAAATIATFESFFATTVVEQKPAASANAPDDYVIRAPLSGTNWAVPAVDGLDSLIQRAYIQHDPIFFSDERPLPPFWNDKFRLRVPVDVAQILRASAVHLRGYTGKGVRVAMPDTGFYHHPYFREQGYNFLSIAAPDTVDHEIDAHGHGTGECANLFATAPGINFVGVKMGSPVLALETAIDLDPDVITNSWGYSVDTPGSSMPNWLKPLYLVVLDAVARGICVCFSAGNGHYGFPGSMPEVISVGGVVVDQNLKYSATPYASGVDSAWFPGRRTPDVCGLCGTPPTADYIVLPVQASAALEKEGGWGAFSGTSAASPMVAGVCALLKQAEPTLTPAQISSLLKHTARDIFSGTNAHGKAAAKGPDGATGFGLVDALRALEAVI